MLVKGEWDPVYIVHSTHARHCKLGSGLTYFLSAAPSRVCWAKTKDWDGYAGGFSGLAAGWGEGRYVNRAGSSPDPPEGSGSPGLGWCRPGWGQIGASRTLERPARCALSVSPCPLGALSQPGPRTLLRPSPTAMATLWGDFSAANVWSRDRGSEALGRHNGRGVNVAPVSGSGGGRDTTGVQARDMYFSPVTNRLFQFPGYGLRYMS